MSVAQPQANPNQNAINNANNANNANANFSSTSLYAGDLHPEVTEAMLFEIFNSVGPVASIRVCRDAITRRSLGYAYINFHSPSDAERALDTLNYTVIRGKPCRIMWSHRDPSLRKSGAGNIFVKNLDKQFDNKSLFDTFSIFGNIMSCKVALDENGQSRGYGFVHYETEESAIQATAKVNGMLIGTKKVFVGPFLKRFERSAPGDAVRFTNVYAKNIPASWTDESLREAFSKFGGLTSAVVMKKDDGESKGFGFVNFDTPEAAKAACDGLNGTEADGKVLNVVRAQKKAERQQELTNKFNAAKAERQQKYMGVNLFVKNVDETVDEDKLREEFAKFGAITSIRIMRDEKTNASKGFAFVCFSSPEEATEAVHVMNSKLLNGKPLFVALAQRKEARRAELEVRYSQRMMQNGMLRQPNLPSQPPMFPGQPMFYPPNMAPQRQGGFMYPQPMMARPGWRPPQAQPGRAPFPMPYGVPLAAAPRQQQQQQQQQPRRNRAAQGQPGQMMGPPSGPNARQPPQQQRGQPQQQGGNYKFPANARGGRPDGQSAPAAEMVPAGQEPLTASVLAAASVEQQKQMLGERLFPAIHSMQPILAGKITGMLLEMDNAELLMLLEQQDSLKEKVEEAVSVLAAHGGGEEAAGEQ